MKDYMHGVVVLLAILLCVILLWAARADGAGYLSNASYYGPGLYGNTTYCGQRLSTLTLGVAHRSLPCGTKLLICHGRRCVTVHVIDRGPYNYSRDLDLTAATAHQLCRCSARSWGVRLVSWKVL